MHARIQDGLVVEFIAPFFEDERLIPITERFPPDFAAALVEVGEGSAIKLGDTYINGTFGPPPVPPPPTASEVLVQRDALLALATTRIAPLQDAVDLDDATAAEVALLKKWKQYRVALSRLEQQAGFPTAVSWPPEPS